MKDKIFSFIKSKKGIIILSLIGIAIFLLIYYSVSKKDYRVFLDLYMPKDSYGSITYTPGNENEFNLYKGSYLNVDYSFSDNKSRDITYIIGDNNVIEVKDNKIIAKNSGTSNIYITTKDNIESNIIKINVISNDD